MSFSTLGAVKLMSLRYEEMTEYMAGSCSWDFQPFAGSLVVTPCQSPLVRPPEVGKQQELF